MGIKNIVVSDISGEEIEDGQVVELVVRNHPKLEAPKRLDVAESEIAGLKSAANVVTVEIKRNGVVETKSLTLAEFDKVVPKKALDNGAPTRGRRKGFSPSANKAS